MTILFLEKLPPAFARAWVRLYTAGMPKDLCDARRAEIDGDLWEQEQESGVLRQPRTFVAVEILVRTLLGVPDDIGWRLEAVRQNQSVACGNRRKTMVLSTVKMRWMAIAAVLAGAIIVGGRIAEMMRDPADGSLRESPAFMLLLALQALLSLLGILGLKAQRREQTGRLASVGFSLLLAGFASLLAFFPIAAFASAMSADSTPLSILLGVLSTLPYLILIPLGFFLIGIGLQRPSRLPLLIIGAYMLFGDLVWWVLGYVLPTVKFPVGHNMSSFLFGIGVAAIGYALWSGARKPVAGVVS